MDMMKYVLYACMNHESVLQTENMTVSLKSNGVIGDAKFLYDFVYCQGYFLLSLYSFFFCQH